MIQSPGTTKPEFLVGQICLGPFFSTRIQVTKLALRSVPLTDEDPVTNESLLKLAHLQLQLLASKIPAFQTADA